MVNYFQRAVRQVPLNQILDGQVVHHLAQVKEGEPAPESDRFWLSCCAIKALTKTISIFFLTSIPESEI